MNAPAGTLPETIASQVIVYPVSQTMIADLRVKYADVPQDLSHKDSYEYVRKAVGELKKYRTAVEARRKELKADALEYGRKVDAAAKELTEGLVSIEEPLATAKKDYDTAEEVRKREIALAEERRVDGINERIAGVRAAVTAHISSSSAAISTVISEISALIPCTWADEFAGKAEEAITDTLGKLTELMQMKEQQEQAEEIRKREEAQRAKEEEERKAREEEERKAEKARIEEENRKLAEERRLIEEEKEKIRKEQEEKDAAAAAEKAKMQAEIEALKKAAEPKPEPVVEKVAEKVEQAPAPKGSRDRTDPNPVFTEDYRAAGNAMLEIIGSRTFTKALLDAIIAGAIPHITYTGA
jgi:hypothetical protein